MQKVLLINLDLLKNDEYREVDCLNVFVREMKELSDDSENVICFYSGDNRKVIRAKAAYENICPNFVFKDRESIKKAMERNKDKANYYVVIGRKNHDFFMAINQKVLFIVPSWLEMEEKAQKYGVIVDNVSQLIMFINTLNNQNYWYSTIHVNSNTTIFSLMDAKYVYNSNSYKEREMVKNFQSLLKRGSSRSYYDILCYHFLSAMTNVKIFDDVKIWGIIPSSNCSLNPDMLNFKEQVRYIKRGIEPRNLRVPNVLIRHTKKDKAQGKGEERLSIGAAEEFETLMVNEEYRRMIEKLASDGELNVCIFDDYLTHGNTFEAVRNLFEKLGANKIICVSLGSFCSTYEKNEYTIQGDVYTANYSYEHCDNERISSQRFTIDARAKIEIESLYNIFNY